MSRLGRADNRDSRVISGLPPPAVLPIPSTAAGPSEGFFAGHGVWAPGVRWFRNLRCGRDGQGFVGHPWTRPGSDEPVNQRSCVKGFAPWGSGLGGRRGGTLAAAGRPGRAADAPAAQSPFDFDAAIEAHRAWKVKLRQTMAEPGRRDAETICRDDACPLGRWLHGPGGARRGGKPSFVERVARHADFRRAAGAVVQRINAGDDDRAERLIGSGSAFARAPTEVTRLLARAERGL
ncbi:MAG: hypothetical protein Fur0014_09500 [Rubrivivax sp.]